MSHRWVRDEIDDGQHYAVLGFKVRPRVLDISRDMQFLSIKDQIVRGRWVVDGLLTAMRAAGGFNPAHAISTDTTSVIKDVDFVILGAGAAGVSAAMRAAHLGASVVLVDRAKRAFSRQIGSRRHVGMSLYDWPAQHWDRAPWPASEPVDYSRGGTAHDPSQLVSPFMVEYAGAFANAWQNQFESFAPGHPSLTFRSGWGLDEKRPFGQRLGFSSRRVHVRIREVHGDDRETLSARFVIFALGPGRENTAVDGYRGPNFWIGEPADIPFDPSNPVFQDPFALDPPKLPNGHEVKSLLISGAGDGGVQDFLRAMLLPGFFDFSQVVSLLRGHDPGAWERLEREVSAAEWQSERARQLGGDRDHLNRALHDRLENAVDTWATNTTGLSLVRKICRSTPPKVRWCLGSKPATFFDKTYALNRVLALMVIAMSKAHMLDVVVEQSRLIKVRTAPAGGYEASIEFQPNPHHADFIIVRHGIHANPAIKAVELQDRLRGLRSAFERLAPPFKPIT